MIPVAEEKNEFLKLNEFLSKKHNLAVLRELLATPHGRGFNAIAKKIAPITPRMLSVRLKELEVLKLIQKNLVLGAKPKIEYRALSKAEGLKKAISEMEKWGKKEL